MKLVALKEITYANKVRKVGDEFETVNDMDGVILVGRDNARLADMQSKNDTPVPEIPIHTNTTSQPVAKRRYVRRDMRAED